MKSSAKKPIQLIRFDQKKNIHLTPQAIDLFTNKLQSNQLSIVCVAGKYRTGKSYILNRVILQQNSGFEVGPTINACTKGLWMWPEIVTIDYCGHKKECIIIDTEGLGSLQQGENTDLKIFLLAMLLSSYLIYNSVGSIDQKALQSLNLVVSMAQLLQKSGDAYDSQQLINTFPSFMWLVRDFSLKLQNQNGQAITSTQYLQNALGQKKAKSAAAERKNQIRRQLKTFFHNRDCFTLIRPTSNQKDLQNLSTLSQKKLRPQFLQLITQLKSRIHHSIQPKRLRGKSITAQGFIQLCNHYITSINSGKLPTISSSWDNLCISESGRVIKKCEVRLKEYVEGRRVEGEEVGAGELVEVCEKMVQEAGEMIDRSFLGKLEKKLLKEKLQKTMKQKMRQVFDTQFKSSQERVQNQIQSLLTQNNSLLNETLTTQEEQLLSSSSSNTKQKSNYNFYHRIDSLKKLFTDFSNIINCRSLENTASSRQMKFLKRMYDRFFEQIQERISKVIEEEFYRLSEENTQLSQKIYRMGQVSQLLNKQERGQIIVLRQKVEQLQRRQNRSSLLNKKLQQQNFLLQQQIATLQDQIITLGEKYQKQQQQQSLVIKNLQQQINSSLNPKIATLTHNKEQLSIKNQSLTQQLKQLHIRERKLHRECDIYKQKFIQKEKLNHETLREVQELRGEITSLERQKRNLIRKTSSKNLNTTFNFNTSLSTSLNQTLTNPTTTNLNQTIIEQPSSNNHTTNQQIQSLLTKINHLQIITKKSLQQTKNITLLYNEQKCINQLIIQTPQSLNYQALKKNYEIEKSIVKKIENKLNLYETSLKYINKVECCICGEFIAKNNILTKNAHYLKCIGTVKRNVEFDVSYAYSPEGELRFLFQVRSESSMRQRQNDPLIRLGLQNNSSKQTKWQVTKCLKSIRMFLKWLQKPHEETKIFTQPEQQQLIKSPSSLKQQQKLQEQRINLNQKRRLYLQELCQQLRQQTWKNNKLIEFFAIDIHLLRQKKTQKKSPPFKRKRLGMLNLDLGEITEENENQGKKNIFTNGNNKILCESLNFMKTTKFSMKKVLKFGPNV